MASKSILLVQLADIGDLALTTPAIAALREAHPRAQIDLLASAQALPILPDGLLDRLIPFHRGGGSASRDFFAWRNLRALLALRQAKYDTIVFFHHFSLRAGLFKFWLLVKASGARRIVGLKNQRVGFLTDWVDDEGFGALHQAQYWLNLVGLLGASACARPALVKREAVPANLLPSAAGPTIVMHTGSGGYSKARRWTAEGFAAVARGLQQQRKAEIVLVGQPEDEADQVEKRLTQKPTNLIGMTTLPQLADIIARADLFIGADSGVMHIAAATGTPVLSIFGPSNPAAWRPWALGKSATVLSSGVACSPCSYIGTGIGAREGCPARTCMKLVEPQQALRTAQRLLDAEETGLVEEAAPARAAPSRGTERRLKLLGLPVDAITYDQWLQRIGGWIALRAGAQHVCTVNPEFIMIAQKDPIFYNILNRAALCVPDGVGLLWASRYVGAPLPERVTGSDGVPLIARYAAERGWSIFFLGAAEGIAERAARILRDRHPKLLVGGSYGGSPAEAEEDEIVAMINSSGADILFVAYGAPEQDKWIARNLPRLEVAMAMGIGGSLDFIAGVLPRAPQWLQARGLEWLYRLLRQPWRLRRMLRLPRFVIAVLRQGKPAKKTPSESDYR